MPEPLISFMTPHRTSASRESRGHQPSGTEKSACSQAAGLLFGGILLIIIASEAQALDCDAPATHGTDHPVAMPESAMTRIEASTLSDTSRLQRSERNSLIPSDLLDIRHGEGLRVVCRQIDGVDTRVESSFTLEDIRPVETGDGNLLISAWENDSSQNVVRSARIELDLAQRAQSAPANDLPVRRANAAVCAGTATGRCSSTIDVRSSVQPQGNRVRVEQETYVNGTRAEWVVWLLDR